MTRPLIWVPFLGAIALFAVIAWGLFRPADRVIHSALVGQKLPAFTLPPIVPGKPGLSTAAFATGKPRLLNVFASWCIPCIAEAPQLLKLQQAGVEIDAVAIRDTPADVAALMNTHVDGEIAEAKRAALVQKIGENMNVRRFVRVGGPGNLGSKVVSYVHGGGRIGVLVEFEGNGDIARDVAMHLAASVASTRAVCVSRDEVPAELIENERKIFAAQAAESGKPADIVAKMVDGRINKYLAEVTLLAAT